MQNFDVSFKNAALWEGCKIEQAAGRDNMVTPIGEAIEIIGKNAMAMNLKGDSITLSGGAPIWAYMVVFHVVVHRFRRVHYTNGAQAEGDVPWLIAAHG